MQEQSNGQAQMNFVNGSIPPSSKLIKYRHPIHRTLQLNTPDTSSARHAHPLATLLREHTGRRPRQIRDLIIAAPAGRGTLNTRRSGMGRRTGLARRRGRRRTSDAIAAGQRAGVAVDDGAAAAQQVPHQHERVVGTRRQHAAARRRPLHRVQRRAVAPQLQQRRAWLPHIQDADQRGVCGEGRE